MPLDLFTLMGTVSVNTANAERGLKRVDGGAKDAARGLTLTDGSARKLRGGADSAGRSSQKLASDLSRVTQSARGTHSAVGILSSGLSGLGSIASGALSFVGGNLLTSAISSVTGKITGEIDKGVQFIKVMERGRVALTAITRDGQLAGRTLEQLGAYADEAGLDLDDTVTGAQRLLGFGYAIDELIPKMRDMGDLAASTGDPRRFQNISVALGQMRSGTRASLEEFNQLRDAGVNALGLLSEATGKTAGELRDLIEAGKVSGQVAADLILDASRRRYSGLAQTLANETLEGREARLENLRGRRAGEAIAPAVGRYSNSVKGAADILAGDTAAAFSQGLGDAAESFFATLEMGVKALSTGKLSALGADASKSLADGVRAGAGAAYDAGAGLGNALEQGYRGHMRQHSPSQLMLELGLEAGASLVEGFANGLKGRRLPAAELESLIREAAERFKVDPNLIREVMYQESRFNPNAKSRAGAAGLMQLMPATARDLGVTDRFDPRQSVMGGTRYLRGLLDEFKDTRLAVAAYNAGPGAVRAYLPNRPDVNSFVGGSGRRFFVSEEAAQRAQGIPQNSQTIDYVTRITARLDAFQASAGGLLGQFQQLPGASSPVPVTVANAEQLRAPLTNQPLTPEQALTKDWFGGFPGGVEHDQRTFGRWLLNAQRETPAAERTTPGEQLEWDTRVAQMRDRLHVTNEFVNLAQEYVERILEVEKEARAMLARRSALDGGHSRPGELPAGSFRFDTDKLLSGLTPGDTRAWPPMLAGVRSVTDAQYELLRALSQTGDVAKTEIGAFTAEQQRANLALLQGGQAAGRLKEQLADFSGDLAGVIRGGFEGGWEEARAGFRRLLLDMAEDYLASKLNQLLQRMSGEKSEGAQAQQQQGGGLNLFGLFEGLLRRATGPRTPNFNPGASTPRDTTPAAVRDAGAQAVNAVTGAGQAQTGAIETAGDATSRGLGNVSRTLLGGLSQIAVMIASSRSGGGFWSGLFQAAAGGAISGFFNGLSSGGGTNPPTPPGLPPGGILAPPEFATGGMLSAAAGGKLIRVAEAGYDELVLSTDPRHKARTLALLNNFMARTGIVPEVPAFAAGGFTNEGPAFVPAPIRANPAASSGGRRGGQAPPTVVVNLKPDREGRIRSRSQVSVEVFSQGERARRYS